MHSTPTIAENPRQTAAVRADLRHDRLAAREALQAAERTQMSSRIEAHLAGLVETRPPAVIAFCWPMKGEFDARPLIVRMIDAGWRAALPVAERNATPLVFRPWTPAVPMATDLFGIPVPDTLETAVPSIVLVPLVAFDDAGYRLGYGGGFFDRTLAGLRPRPLAVGVGFEVGRVATVHPQTHDIPMDAIVTETGVRRFTF